MKTAKYIKINPADTVVVCLEAMKQGETVVTEAGTIEVLQDTPAGHKILLNDTPAGENIIKYGYPIGHAAIDLKAGQWVNENNLKTNLKGTLSYEYHPVPEVLSDNASQTPLDAPSFKGYVRRNGEVGIRNEIWIVPTVGCVNGIAERLAHQLQQETGLQGIDAIHAWHHNFGCSQLSGDHENTRKILRDIVLHPNAGAVLVIGLGCAAVGTAALLVKKHPVAAGIVGVIVYLLLLTELLMNGRILFSVPVSAVIITAVVTGIKRRARIRAGTKTDNGVRGNKSST